MTSVRDLAAEDACDIINAEGAPITLINKDGEINIRGLYSDIGSLINPVTGEPVQGRAIEAVVFIFPYADKIPERGWKARVSHNGREVTLFVQRNEYDRTAGLCRLTLGLTLQETEGGE